MAAGIKTIHATHRRPPYPVGAFLTFFSHQNGVHHAVTVQILAIEQQDSYISLVNTYGPTRLVPWSAKPRRTIGKKISPPARIRTTRGAYDEYRWLLTERRVGRSKKPPMEVHKFLHTQPWAVRIKLHIPHVRHRREPAPGHTLQTLNQ